MEWKKRISGNLFEIVFQHVNCPENIKHIVEEVKKQALFADGCSSTLKKIPLAVSPIV